MLISQVVYILLESRVINATNQELDFKCSTIVLKDSTISPFESNDIRWFVRGWNPGDDTARIIALIFVKSGWNDGRISPITHASHRHMFNCVPYSLSSVEIFFRCRVQAALAERVRYARKSAPHTILVARPAFHCNTKLRHIVDYSPAAIHRGQTPCYRNAFAWEYVNA